MEPRRLLPYIAGLLILAFTLGSLPRSQAGGSILFRSTWLLYLIYLAPIVVLCITIALIVLVAMNWRDITGAVGFQMARQRKMRKRGSRWSVLIAGMFWALAIGVLMFKKGSIFNPETVTNSTLAQVQNTQPITIIQFAGIIPSISGLIDNRWFGLAFLGLVVLGGLVLAQSVRVAFRETREMNVIVIDSNRAKGLEAVHEAIRLVKEGSGDPRSRIVACYQHLLLTSAKLGAPVSPNLTARELEHAIRSTFALQGRESTDLTNLFEEARYSLHEILEDDANAAQGYLRSIAEELHVELQSEN